MDSRFVSENVLYDRFTDDELFTDNLVYTDYYFIVLCVIHSRQCKIRVHLLVKSSSLCNQPNHLGHKHSIDVHKVHFPVINGKYIISRDKNNHREYRPNTPCAGFLTATRNTRMVMIELQHTTHSIINP